MPPLGGPPAPFRSEKCEHNGPSPRAERLAPSREAGAASTGGGPYVVEAAYPHGRTPASATPTEKRFPRRRKIIGRPPFGRKVMRCTGNTL
jgi:hypothetical protein